MHQYIMISIIQYERHAHIYYSQRYTYIYKRKGRNKSKNNDDRPVLSIYINVYNK